MVNIEIQDSNKPQTFKDLSVNLNHYFVTRRSMIYKSPSSFLSAHHSQVKQAQQSQIFFLSVTRDCADNKSNKSLSDSEGMHILNRALLMVHGSDILTSEIFFLNRQLFFWHKVCVNLFFEK